MSFLGTATDKTFTTPIDPFGSGFADQLLPFHEVKEEVPSEDAEKKNPFAEKDKECELFSRRLNEKFRAIDHQMGVLYSMLEQGHDVGSLIASGQKAHDELKPLINQYEKNCRTYQAKKDGELLKHQKTKDKIQSIHLNFASFVLPVKVQKKEDPEKAIPVPKRHPSKTAPAEKSKKVSFEELIFVEERLTTIGTHVAARFGAMTYEGLNHAIYEGTKTTVDAVTVFHPPYPMVLAVKYGTQKACQINPHTQKTCQTIAKKVADIPKLSTQEIKQKVPQSLKKAVSNLSAHRNKRIEDFARINEKLYGIPPEMTRQYHKDSSTVLANTALFAIPVPIGSALKFSQRIFKGATSTVPKATASSRFTLINPEQSKILSTTMYEIETRNEEVSFIRRTRENSVLQG